MTNQSSEEVLTYFSQLAEPDFARTGGVATDTVVLGERPLSDFGHSMEPQVTGQTLWSTASKTYALREAIEKKSGLVMEFFRNSSVIPQELSFFFFF